MPDNEKDLEIERKFLVKEIPEALQPDKVEDIQQGYLLVAADHSEIRVRKKGKGHYLTLKKPADEYRTEVEIEIDPGQFNKLWPHTRGKRVEKNRATYPHDGHLLEVDTYKGKNEGLITVDVEFDTKTKSSEFSPPDWFGEEITDNEKYRNQNLAG